MRHLIVAALVTAIAIVAVLGTQSARHGESGASPQDAWKAAHAAKVVAELEARDVSHLTPSQRAERRRMLDELLRYGKRGRFAQNEAHPGEAIPHLIDAHGNRCALANLIDVAGDDALLTRLAASHNIAFVPELQQDRELGDWLRRHGLTVEEAAYIQGPGFVDPPSREVPPGIPPDPSERVTRGGPGTPGDAPTTPGVSGPTPTTGRTGTSITRGSTRRGGAAALDWQTWWTLNRHAFLNVRERYHAGVVLTGDDGTAARGRRPSEEEIDATVVPLLRRLATGEDKHVRTTALMAWARVARPRHAPEVIEAARAFIANPDNAWRDVMILALGIVRHPDALPTLRAIAHDTKDGRRAMRKNGALVDRVRAMAVVALGQCGQEDAAADLMQILDDRRTKSTDLKACAVMALGTLSRDVEPGTRRRIGVYLVKGLRKEAWDDVVAAQVPTALAHAGDTTIVVPTLQPVLERFRKPTAVRQSSALAMATLAPVASEGLLDAMIATARRDPDDAARRFGILALGEVAKAQHDRLRTDDGKAEAYARMGRKLRGYYEGAFAGRNIQKSDLPWLCLSAALYGRGYPEQRTWIRERLERVANAGGLKDREAAAVVALGLLGDAAAVPTLRAKYGKAKDKLVRGYLAESLGILGDKSQRDDLLALVREDGDGDVRYRAALGLGFTADQGTLRSLVDVFATTPSQDAQVALARVIGELGDRRALPTLIQIASDPKADTWARRRALGAIGMIGQQADHAWTTAFHRGVNYPVATPTLRMILALF